MFSMYNKEIRPGENHSNPVHVMVEFELLQIREFKELEGSLTTTVMLMIYWNDNRITWDPSNYNGIERLYVRQKFVWLPEIYLSNSQSGITRIRSNDQNIIYDHSGKATWGSLNTFDSSCDANTINYPFDRQSCHFFFVPYINDNREVVFKTKNPVVRFGEINRNGEWTVSSMNGSSTRYRTTVSFLYYNISFFREAKFIVVTMLAPVCFLGLLNIFIFVIPAVSGERIGFGVTILLAVGVYLSILSDNLPKSSKPDAAKICYKLANDIAMAGAIMFCTIVSLVFYHKDENSKVSDKVAACVRFGWKCWSCKDKLYQPKPSSKHGDNGTMDAPENNGKVSSEESNQRFDNVVLWRDFAFMLDVVFIIVFSLWFVLSNVLFILSVAF